METEKDLLMFYHTSIRNVGLFTSVSLALLAVSRHYRGRRLLYNSSFIIISLLFLIAAMLMCLFLIQTLEQEKKKVKNLKYIESLELVAKLTLTIDVIISIFIIFTLIRQLNK